MPGSGRSSQERNGYPLQYSCLENPMHRGSWWATVHGVAKSRTRLSEEHFRYFSEVSYVNSRGKIKTQSHISRGGWLGMRLLSLTRIQNSWRACSAQILALQAGGRAGSPAFWRGSWWDGRLRSVSHFEHQGSSGNSASFEADLVRFESWHHLTGHVTLNSRLLTSLSPDFRL